VALSFSSGALAQHQYSGRGPAARRQGDWM